MAALLVQAGVKKSAWYDFFTPEDCKEVERSVIFRRARRKITDQLIPQKLSEGCDSLQNPQKPSNIKALRVQTTEATKFLLYL